MPNNSRSAQSIACTQVGHFIEPLCKGERAECSLAECYFNSSQFHTRIPPFSQIKMIILNHSVSSDEENDSALDLSISSSRQKSPTDAEVDKPSYKLKKSMIRRYCKCGLCRPFNFFVLFLLFCNASMPVCLPGKL